MVAPHPETIESTRWGSNPLSLRITALLFLLALVAVGCGGVRDDRNDIRAKHGEPDEVRYNEGPVTDYEYWTYYNFQGGEKDYEFSFQRSRNACGASKNWLLIREREVTPVPGFSRLEPGHVRLNPRTSNPIRP